MPTYTALELAASRRQGDGTNRFAELLYQVVGTDGGPYDEDGAAAAALAVAPATFNSMPRRSTTVEPVNGDNLFNVRLRYEPRGQRGEVPTPVETGGYRIEFDASGTTQNITQGLTETQYPPTADSFFTALNVTESGPEGLDVEVQSLRWTERHYVSNADMTVLGWAGLVAIRALTKRVNDAAFRGFAAGEVFFRSFRASPRTDEDWELVYEFEAMPNLTGQTVAGITGIDKGGHEYLWVRYQKTEGTDDLVEEPKAVYVNGIYDAVDFAAAVSVTGHGVGILPLIYVAP